MLSANPFIQMIFVAVSFLREGTAFFK